MWKPLFAERAYPALHARTRADFLAPAIDDSGRSEKGPFAIVNTSRNIPIMLRPMEDGSFQAECLMVPGCVCTGRTRQQALEMMQSLIKKAVREERVSPTRYEIVYLAVSA
jgi:predicted RNase H-like HicB family nuclease